MMKRFKLHYDPTLYGMERVSSISFSRNRYAIIIHRTLSKSIPINNNKQKEMFAVIRIDTHGTRFLVKQHMSFDEAKELEKHYDSMPHHQGYLVVKQSQIQEELEQKN